MSDRVASLVLVAYTAVLVVLASVLVAAVATVEHATSVADLLSLDFLSSGVGSIVALVVGGTAYRVGQAIAALSAILTVDGLGLLVAAFACLVAAYAVIFVGPSSSWDYLHRRGAMAYRVISPDYVDGVPYVAPTALAIAPHAALVRRHAARLAADAAALAAALDETRVVVAQQWADATVEIERLADCHARATASRHRTRAASYARRVLETDAVRWDGTTPCYLAA